jgi:hypothetical protein
MLKHQIEMAEVRAYGKADDSYESIDAGIVGEHDVWKTDFLGALASIHQVRCAYYEADSSKHRRIILLGRPETVRFVRMMWAHLCQQIDSKAFAEVARRMSARQQARKYVLNNYYTQPQYQQVWTGYTSYTVTYYDRYSFLGPPTYEAVVRKGKELAEDPLCVSKIAHELDISHIDALTIHKHLTQGEIAPEFVDDLLQWRLSFVLGASAVVAQRLQAHYDKMVKEEGKKGTDLVKNEMANLKNWLRAQGMENLAEDPTPEQMREQNERVESHLNALGLKAGMREGLTIDVNIHEKLDTPRVSPKRRLGG